MYLFASTEQLREVYNTLDSFSKRYLVLSVVDVWFPSTSFGTLISQISDRPMRTCSVLSSFKLGARNHTQVKTEDGQHCHTLLAVVLDIGPTLP